MRIELKKDGDVKLNNFRIWKLRKRTEDITDEDVRWFVRSLGHPVPPMTKIHRED